MIKVTTLGEKVGRLLGEASGATLVGRTSRGLYLRLDSDWIIFISQERWRGPLTVNIAGEANQLHVVLPGQSIQITPQRLSHPEAGWALDFRGAQTWQPPQNLRSIQPLATRGAFLTRVIEDMPPRQIPEDLATWLGDLASQLPPVAEVSGSLQASWIDLRAALQTSQTQLLGLALERFLGAGTGLTPVGDDLVLGFMLALNRFGSMCEPVLEIDELNRAMVKQSYARTTTLSANLIECACAGQADERLITGLDGLATGEPGVAACAEALAQWGSSSGYAALVGMGLVCAYGGQGSG